VNTSQASRGSGVVWRLRRGGLSFVFKSLISGDPLSRAGSRVVKLFISSKEGIYTFIGSMRWTILIMVQNIKLQLTWSPTLWDHYGDKHSTPCLVTLGFLRWGHAGVPIPLIPGTVTQT
jgi:hypothetical protein